MDKSSVVLITGSSSGIGKAAAAALAKTGAHIIMLCRNKERGEAALEEVRKASNNGNVRMMLCNLADLSDVRRFCNEFKSAYDRLDVLVNNAGVITPKRCTTEQGYEIQFGVNHLGHFLLTSLLIDLLVKSAPTRIVIVASDAHKSGRIHYEDINMEKKYTIWGAYSQSKLANILFSYELARKLENTGVTVNCLHPGAVATSIGIDRDTGARTFITSIFRPFFMTPEKGADTIVYLASSKDVEGITGKYYYKRKPILSSKSTYNEENAKKLWKLSEEMTNDWR